jgi:hypothetical protein
MKVKELIEKLQKYPEDMEVVIDGTFDPDADIEFCEIIVKKATFPNSTYYSYIHQKSYQNMLDDGELYGDYVDEKVIYLC